MSREPWRSPRKSRPLDPIWSQGVPCYEFASPSGPNSPRGNTPERRSDARTRAPPKGSSRDDGRARVQANAEAMKAKRPGGEVNDGASEQDVNMSGSRNVEKLMVVGGLLDGQYYPFGVGEPRAKVTVTTPSHRTFILDRIKVRTPQGDLVDMATSAARSPEWARALVKGNPSRYLPVMPDQPDPVQTVVEEVTVDAEPNGGGDVDGRADGRPEGADPS